LGATRRLSEMSETPFRVASRSTPAQERGSLGDVRHHIFGYHWRGSLIFNS
jgi:hypothetical protein